MFGKYLFLLLACFAIISLARKAQQQPQQVALTREIVEGLLQVLTPTCRNELEAAIEAQQGTDLSDECKYEIQMNLQEMNPNSGAPSPLEDGYEDDYQQPNEASSESNDPPKHIINPVVGIFLFVGALLGAIAFAVFYINSQVGDFKPKKISKKKVIVISQQIVLFNIFMMNYSGGKVEGKRSALNYKLS